MKKLVASFSILFFTTFTTAHSQTEQETDLSILEAMVHDLSQKEAVQILKGAIAACLAGQGDADFTANLFASNGWDRRDDADMGIYELTNPETDEFYALVADDGSACRVWSEEIGTTQAFDLLKTVAIEANLTANNATGEIGCEALSLIVETNSFVVEVTSSGNDPFCEHDSTSGVHFIRAEG